MKISKVGMVMVFSLASLSILIGFQNCSGSGGFTSTAPSNTQNSTNSPNNSNSAGQVTTNLSAISLHSPEVQDALSGLNISVNYDTNTVSTISSSSNSNGQISAGGQVNFDCAQKPEDLDLNNEATLIQALARNPNIVSGYTAVRQKLQDAGMNKNIGECPQENISGIGTIPKFGYGLFAPENICEYRRGQYKKCQSVLNMTYSSDPSVSALMQVCQQSLNNQDYYVNQYSQDANQFDKFFNSIESIYDLSQVEKQLIANHSSPDNAYPYGSGLDALVQKSVEKTLKPRKKLLMSLYGATLESARLKLAKHLYCSTPYKKVANLFSATVGGDGMISSYSDINMWSSRYVSGCILGSTQSPCSASNPEATLAEDILSYSRDLGSNRVAFFGYNTTTDLQTKIGSAAVATITIFGSDDTKYQFYFENAAAKTEIANFAAEVIRHDLYKASETVVETILKSYINKKYDKMEAAYLYSGFFGYALARNAILAGASYDGMKAANAALYNQTNTKVNNLVSIRLGLESRLVEYRSAQSSSVVNTAAKEAIYKSAADWIAVLLN